MFTCAGDALTLRQVLETDLVERFDLLHNELLLVDLDD